MTSLYKSRPDSGDYTGEIEAALVAAQAAQTAAELAETNAEAAATTATTMAGNASTSATNAATSESTASAASVAAVAAKNLAEAAAVSAAASEAVVFGAVPTTRTVNSLVLSSDITLDTSDIADSTDARYVTDADLVKLSNLSGTNTGDQDLSTLVPKTTTVNGYALSSNVTLDTSDVADTVNARYVSDADLVNLSNLSGTNTGDQDLSTLVPKTTTVNGYALSSNISLSKSDVGLSNVTNTDTTNPANITQSSSYRFVTDTEKSTWNGKQDTLVVYSGVFGSIPAASGYSVGDQAFATDVGENGTYFVVSAYNTWIPLGGVATLSQLTLPVGKAPTFTGTTNGAITFGSAVSRNDKCYMYYPANSLVASHAAGFYYTECSSTTAAVVYNNTYVPASGTYPTEPVSKTAFSGAVPGGTGATTEVTAFIYGVPANIMGPHGSIDVLLFEEHNTSTGKTVRIKAGGTTIASFASGTNVRASGSSVTTNNGATNVQKSFGSAAVTTPNQRTTIDTTASFAMSVSLQGGATDHSVLTFCEILLRRTR